MSQISNPLDIYKLLPKSNCRKCDMRTCLAFADAVIKGQKALQACPHLDDKIVRQFEGKITTRALALEGQQEKILEQLKKDITSIDFFSSAKRLGAAISGEELIIKSLGKDFFVDKQGNITSECHINTWLTIPLLNYILSCKGTKPSGKWVPFGELENGRDRLPLFEQRCEKPLKKIADTHMDLFFDKVIYIFGGRPVETRFTSDVSLIIYPLPKVPILISYSKPEDNGESRLNLFFDNFAEDNLNIESIHMLCTGIVTMFEKIASRHGSIKH